MHCVLLNQRKTPLGSKEGLFYKLIKIAFRRIHQKQRKISEMR